MTRHIRVVAAVVKQDGRYLITQRRAEAVLGNLWEFPGGRVEPGESDEEALRRELRVRLGADAAIGARLAERRSAYADYDVTLALYAATFAPDAPLAARRVQAFRWVPSGELDQYEFPAADQQTMDALLGIRR